MWDETYENCIETDRKLKELIQITPFTSNGNSNSAKESDEAESQGSEKDLQIDLGLDDLEDVTLEHDMTVLEKVVTSNSTDILDEIMPEAKDIDLEIENKVQNIDLHQATDSNQNQLKCMYCDIYSPIKSQRDLNEHYRAEHFDSVFHCEMCDNFLDRNDLMPHMVQHALESAVQQSVDVPSSKEQNSVQDTSSSSVAIMQPPTSLPPPAAQKPKTGKENQLYCTVCQKHFNTRSGYAYHINQLHSKIKNYSCSFCDKKFGMKRILDNHIRNIHSSEKTFQCMKCFKYFKTDAALYNHEIIHKQSNYVCELCNKKFHYKHNLEVHRLLHSNDRKYSCNHCSSTFKTRNYLAKHLKGHFSDTKNFSCSYCDFKTTQKRYLSEHVKRKHSNK